MSNNIYIVVPSYNEECAVLRATISRLTEKGYRTVVVDDGSNLPCSECLKEIDVHIIRHKVNLGQGAAIQTGIEYALKNGAEYIVTFDADGQHDVEDIPKMLQHLEKNQLDFVFGSRFMKGAGTNVSLGRRILLYISIFLNYLISGVWLSDCNNGLRLFNAKAASMLKIQECRRTHCSDIITQVAESKLRFDLHPVNVAYTPYSKGKGIKSTDGLKIFLDLILYKLFR